MALAFEYADGMLEHDAHIGQFLTQLDELGIADNTIVFYSTDNGPHLNTWPDAAMTPFRGEKNTNWEGGWRVPSMVRWLGKIEAGSVSNEIMHHMNWMPTLLAAAGEPDVKEKLLKGHRAIGRKYNVHLDGYNFLPHLTGKEPASYIQPALSVINLKPPSGVVFLLTGFVVHPGAVRVRPLTRDQGIGPIDTVLVGRWWFCT